MVGELPSKHIVFSCSSLNSLVISLPHPSSPHAQLAINEANTLSRCPAGLVSEKTEFLYRSYLALGQYHIILSEIKDVAATPVGLRAVKFLAQYLSDNSQKDAALAQVQEWLADMSVSSNSLKLIAAVLYMHDDNMKDALKAIKNPTDLEQHALTTQIYLRMDRLDLAQRQLKSMRAVDEDSTLTQLTTAWIHLSTPGKAQDASYIFEELSDKHGASAMLLNGLAVSKMHQASFEEAETLLQEAMGKASSDPDTLANLICVSQHLSRAPEVVGRYLAQLKAKAPTHQLVTTLGTFEGAYDRVAATLRT